MHHRRTTSLLIALLLALLSLGARADTAGPVRIDVRANPDRLPADGRSQATIIADVSTASGAPVPDGTTVRFATTLGTITSPARTSKGLAQATLTASDGAGWAIVSAIVGDATGQTRVLLAAPPGGRAAASRLVELTGDELSYSADRCLLLATWHARLQYRGLELRADSIQYEVMPGTIRAQGNVVLKSAKREVHADALRWSLITLHGRLIAISGDTVQRLVVDGDDLETQKDDEPTEALWEPLPTDETRTWVKAKQALVDPGQRIILDHAVIYVDNNRVMSLRRQVLRPTPNPALFSDVLGFSTSGGIRLDFPYYYRASAHGLGSLVLRHNSFYGPGDGTGWSLGLEDDYNREGKLDGSLQVDDIIHPQRGLSFQHRQRFGDLSMDLIANTSILTGGVDTRFRAQALALSYPVKSGVVSLQLGGSAFGSANERTEDLGYSFASRPIGAGIVASPSIHLQETQREIQQDQVIVDPSTGEPLPLNKTLTGQSTAALMGVGLTLPARKLGRDLLFTGLINTGYAMEFQGLSTPFLDAKFGLDQKLREGGRISLAYQLSLAPSATQTGLITPARQSLNLTGAGTIKGAKVNANIALDLQGGRRYGWLTLQKPLPFGKDPFGHSLWTLEASHMFTQFGKTNLASSRIGLVRELGRLTLSVNYSPQGLSAYGDSRPWINPWAYGYTYSGGRHLWIEVGTPID